MEITANWTGCGAAAGRLQIPAVQMLCPVISIFLDSLRSTWLASDLEWVLIQNKLPTPDYRYLTVILYMLLYKS
jgi:hypothetical protein